MTLISPALRLLLAALTCFRLGELFAVDYGPFYIFDFWRKLLGKWASGKSKYGLAHSLAELFHCPFCLGIWFAAPAAYFWMYPTFLSDVLMIWLGLAGAQSFLQSLSGFKRE
jgi:hypothetical protein